MTLNPEQNIQRRSATILAEQELRSYLTESELIGLRSEPRKEQLKHVAAVKDALHGWRTHGAPHGCMLIGAVGSGKTWVAQRIMLEGARAGLRGCYVDLLIATAAMRGRDHQDESPLHTLTAATMRSSIVVIDDVGATDGADVRLLVSSVLHAAWRAGAFVVITGNLTPEAFYSWVGGGTPDQRIKSKVEPFVKVRFSPADVPDYRNGRMV